MTTTQRPTRAPIRMRTVVVGLVALAVSANVLLTELTGSKVPDDVLALAVLIGAGLLLLGNGIVTAAREQRARVEQSDPYLSATGPGTGVPTGPGAGSSNHPDDAGRPASRS